ncbi:MAG: cyclic nucleotide-binding domain-containing protein [Dongiaceae bacterium]
MSTRQLAHRQQEPAPTTVVGSPCNHCEVREISVCGVLTAAEIERLRAILNTQHYEAGQIVIREGDSADSLFNVVSGTVRLYKLLPDGRRQITGFLLPGDFLGIALNDVYAYTAEAVDTVHLCRFPRRRLEALLSEMPSLEHSLLGRAAGEIVLAQDQMLLLGRKTARERVASFLLMMAEREGRAGRRTDRIELAMTRSDIADFLGLTTETVSRTLSQLKQDGMIGIVGRGRVDLLRPESLVELRDAG